MVAPVLASQTDLETSSSTVTLTVPSGTVDGDLLVAFVSPARDGVFPITAPSGWTQIFTNQWAANGPISECYVRSASSEPASYSWTFDSSDNLVATMLRVTGWSGVIGDIDFYVSPSTELSTATIPSGAITGLAPDSLLIGWVACEVGDQSYSPPSGWTEFFDLGQTRSNSDRVWASGAYLDYASGGSSPLASFTNTADPSRANGVAMLSVAPSSGGVASYDADVSAISPSSVVSSSSTVSVGSSAGIIVASSVVSSSSGISVGSDASAISPQSISSVSASFTPIGSTDSAVSASAPSTSASVIASVSVAASSTTSTRVGNISSSASVSVGADIWPVSPSPTVRISAGDILAISDDRTYPIGSVVREIKQPNQSRRAVFSAVSRITSA